jgi:2-succinyl-5-enolpyruvyl-6-hydroxy-3-cyclohexene-1-carboxylate synthase
VAISCTSGTAAANLAPAVIEAHEARVPLIVLTADRPPELREVGAGQTIDQVKLYGDAAKWFFEVDLHDGSAESLRWIRTLACRAYWTALTGPAGPVHLNFPLREPLAFDEPLPEDETSRAGGRPYVDYDRPRFGRPLGGQHPFGRVVIVAGREEHDPLAAPLLAQFAARMRIPLLADPLSGARAGQAAIAHYDLLLRDPDFCAAHEPQFVLRVGDLPTSKPLRAWLAGLQTAQIAIDPDDSWQDPASVVGLRVSTPYRALLEGLESGEPVPAEDGWLESWRAADQTAATAIDVTLGDELSEPFVARRLGALLPPEAIWFVASSMPVRDVEEFMAARDGGPRILSNRGANGIDGTVSSAFGVAAAGSAPVVLLIGDVALAHDVGGLLAARRLGLKLTIVLLNNDGGGIFHFLPVAGQTDAFEEHVATPHGLGFAAVAGVYGCRHELIESSADLTAAVEAALGSGQTEILEVRTDRAENLALHRRVAEAVATALSRREPATGPGA